ncbi:hypothetical protein B0T17DRAFT_594026 [Bombardia bombarda]|uniref:Uncharacterized protein n=1 Tax=Bombardia bombarda TaxID=252184 RepID=A0AA39U2Q9_9PEZI|nr:hypothetical protein B0T17DRAFT_594026 [Bombardia bombarda]
MGMQLEPLTQSSFEYGPWHYRDIRFQQAEQLDLGSALLGTATSPSLTDRLCETSRIFRAQRMSATRAVEESPWVPRASKLMPKTSSPTVKTSSRLAALANTTAPYLDLGLSRTASTGSEDVLTFPLKVTPPPPRPSLKRRRPTTDVDGPNTACMGCKKRRLRRHLITSRLSEPFSYPASHILNRESATSGDRRLLKMAAILSTRRLHSTAGMDGVQLQPLPLPLPPPQPSPSSLLRRTAVINRFRLRVRTEAVERGDDEVADLAASAALLQQSHGVGLVVGSRFPLASPPPSTGPPSTGPPPPPLRIPFLGHPHPLSKAGIEARLQPLVPPSRPQPVDAAVPCRRLPPSPRLRPARSPELRPTWSTVDLDVLEDLDDDNVAFPTSEHESRYEDEPDDVYADFGVIFGSGGDGDLTDDEGPGEHFEDYMDDLDGIPWSARC